MGVFKDLTGKKFNRLTVLGLGKRNSSGQIQWKCRCDCGNIVFATSSYLKSGHTKSCGCLNREKSSNRLKNKKFIEAKNNYRKNNFLAEGTSLALIRPKHLRKNNSTGINGVYWDKKLKKYRARINVKGKNISLGCFKDLKDAKKARKLAEDKYYKPIIDKYLKGGDCNMEEKNTKSPKDLITEQETSELKNMTEGQLAEYFAENEI